MDYIDLRSKLREGNLADTFPLIRQKVAEMGNWELSEETENLWTTYRQMLQFMLQGMNDAQSTRIRANICQQLSFVASRLERLERIKNHPEEKYVSTRKELKNIASFENIEVCEFLSEHPLEAGDLMETLGIAEIGDKFPAQLSGGADRPVRRSGTR